MILEDHACITQCREPGFAGLTLHFTMAVLTGSLRLKERMEQTLSMMHDFAWNRLKIPQLDA